MKYVERVLQPGEAIVYATSLHWLIYLRAIVLLVIALVCLVVSGWFAAEPGIGIALQIVAAFFALWGVLSAVNAFIQRTTTELAITDRRVIYKTGIIKRHTMEMNRSKVETVGVDQSILGRMLGFGTVIVRGTGGSFEPIRHIDDPLTFRSHITAS